MKAKQLIMLALFIAAAGCICAQTGQWSLSGNNLSGTEKIGSNNNQPLKFFTNKKQRMTLTSNGNLSFDSDTSSIQFPVSGPSAKPMIFMFPSGTSNSTRMVIAHSPAFPLLGLSYNDFEDKFSFKGSSIPALSINLAKTMVGIGNASPAFPLDVSGFARITGNVGIGGSPTNIKLHIAGGTSGAIPISNSTIAAESNSDNFLSLLAPSVNKSAILFGNTNSNQDGAIVFNNPSTPHGMQFNTSSITRMTITGGGNVGIGTTSPAVQMHILHNNTGAQGFRIQNTAANGKNWNFFQFSDGDLGLFSTGLGVGFFDAASGDYSTASDVRLKKNIEPAPDVLGKVMQLDIKKYHFLQNETSGKKHYGMIAQDVEKIFPEVVTHEFLDSGKQDFYTMNYSAFGVIALKAIQELQKQKDGTVDSLKAEISSLRSEIKEIRAALQKGNAGGASYQAINTTLTSASLQQNVPNPFANATSIRYTLPQKLTTAQIIVTDKKGNNIKKLNVSGKGNGVVNIDASSLVSGSYNYALVIDGKMVDSKQFILVK